MRTWHARARARVCVCVCVLALHSWSPFYCCLCKHSFSHIKKKKTTPGLIYILAVSTFLLTSSNETSQTSDIFAESVGSQRTLADFTSTKQTSPYPRNSFAEQRSADRNKQIPPKCSLSKIDDSQRIPKFAQNKQLHKRTRVSDTFKIWVQSNITDAALVRYPTSRCSSHQKHSRPLPTKPYRPMRTRARTEESNQVESVALGSVPCHREPNSSTMQLTFSHVTGSSWSGTKHFNKKGG